jgi:hypothetical protein
MRRTGSHQADVLYQKPIYFGGLGQAFSRSHESRSDIFAVITYLSFLFYWQVLEIEGYQAIGFIDKVYRKHRTHLRLSESEISRLPLAGRSLGKYLSDDCRHAIAHITRRPASNLIIWTNGVV